MSRLLNVYPAAWRERYGAEVEELLLARPPTLRDRLDLLRGALDAWAHPQVRRPATASAHDRFGPRAATVVAILGGALFVVSGWRIASTLGLGPDGYRDNGFAIPLLVLGMLLTAVAALLLSTDRWPRRVAMVAIGGSLLMVLPWPIMIVGFFAYVGAAIALGVLLVARGRVAGLALMAAGIVLPFFNTETDSSLVVICVGVLWILFGLASRPPALTVPRARAPRRASP
jgi:hypothetical protein